MTVPFPRTNKQLLYMPLVNAERVTPLLYTVNVKFIYTVRDLSSCGRAPGQDQSVL